MQSILEELYYGNIRLDSRFYEKDSTFVKAAHVKHDCMEKLKAVLAESEKELFEKYCDSQSGIEGITRYDTFKEALRFGILLMVEIFTDKDKGGVDES